MTEYAQDFEVFQGDTRQITIPITDEAGAAKTITGSTQRWQAHDKTSGLVVVAKTDGEISIVSVAPASNNAIRFTLDPADTLSLEATSDADPQSKKYDHEVEIVDSSSNPNTVTRGTMTVRKHLIV